MKKWLVGCGLGCVALIIVAAVLTVLGYRILRILSRNPSPGAEARDGILTPVRTLKGKSSPIPEARDWVFYYTGKPKPAQQREDADASTISASIRAFRPFRPWGKGKRIVIGELLDGEGRAVYPVPFDVSRDGKKLAVASIDRLLLIDVQTGKCLWTFKQPDYYQNMPHRPVFSHDGNKVAVLSRSAPGARQNPEPAKVMDEMTLHVFAVEDGSRRELSSGLGSGSRTWPIWSPDDSFVYGTNAQRHGSNWHMRVMRVEVESGKSEVLELTQDALEVWAVTDNSIVYYGYKGQFSQYRRVPGTAATIWKCRLDGTEIKVLRTTEGRFNVLIGGGLSSPDGRYVFVTEHVGRAVVWMGFLDIENEAWHHPE